MFDRDIFKYSSKSPGDLTWSHKGFLESAFIPHGDVWESGLVT